MRWETHSSKGFAPQWKGSPASWPIRSERPPTKQLRYRNRPNGYWIAEADPIAAEYAVTSTHHTADIPWMVLATDGAAERISAVGFSWDQVAACNSDSLNRLLERCHRWEAETDPNGRLAPRAKRHDDKTLVVAIP